MASYWRGSLAFTFREAPKGFSPSSSKAWVMSAFSAWRSWKAARAWPLETYSTAFTSCNFPNADFSAKMSSSGAEVLK